MYPWSSRIRFFFITRLLPLLRPLLVFETDSAGSSVSFLTAGSGSSSGSGASSISSSACSDSLSDSSFSSSSSSSIIFRSTSSRSCRLFLMSVRSAAGFELLVATISESSASPSSDRAIAESSSFLGVGLGLAGFAAALAKDCMIPPDAPRFRGAAGFFPPLGAGAPSLDEDAAASFLAALVSFLLAAADEASCLGFAVDSFFIACDGADAGGCRRPFRSLRRAFGLLITPYFLDAEVMSPSVEYSESCVARSDRREKSFCGCGARL